MKLTRLTVLLGNHFTIILFLHLLSNCVINLVPNKKRAFQECFRVLKSGGRLAISDIAFKKILPEPLASNVRYWTGCIAGAIPVDTMRNLLLEVGFKSVDIIDAKGDLNVYKAQKKEAAGNSSIKQ